MTAIFTGTATIDRGRKKGTRIRFKIFDFTSQRAIMSFAKNVSIEGIQVVPGTPADKLRAKLRDLQEITLRS